MARGGYYESVKKSFLNCNNVFFVGWVDYSKIITLAELSIASIAPYKNIENYQYNLPNKIIDSLSLGKPVITPLKGAMEELINKEQIGYVYDDSGPNNLLIILKNMINDKNRVKMMSSNAKLYYNKKLSYEKNYKKALDVMLKVYSNKL